MERSHIDFSRLEVDSGALLVDGAPDRAELDQYLKPAPVPDYHELQPGFATHSHSHAPGLYQPSNLYPHCEWPVYTGHS